MAYTHSSDANKPLYDSRVSAPQIPTRKMPRFMKALWAFAVLMVIGIVYSFWRISSVATPTLDVPQGQSTDTAAPR